MPRLRASLRWYLLPALVASTAVLCCAAPAFASASDWVSVRFPAPYTHATSHRAVVAVSEGSDGAVWAVTNDGVVFVLRKGASKWTQVSAGLPRGPGDKGIQGVEDILAAAGKVYLNCDHGVFVLPRGSDRWHRVSENGEPQVFYLTVWDGYVWGVGALGVERLDPDEDRWTEVSDGLPYLAGEQSHAGSSFWVTGTKDYLYLGVQETQEDNPRFDKAGVYRLPRGTTTWQNAGLRVKLAPQEIKHLKTEKEARRGASWGPAGTWASGGYVLCEWGGLSYEGFVRFYVLDESTGVWTQLREPGGGSGGRAVLEELVDVYTPSGRPGRFAFVGVCDPREREGDAMVYDATAGSWSAATLPVVGWPAGGWSNRDASWGWVLAGDSIVTGDPEGTYAPPASGFVASVPLPTQVSRDPAVVGTNMALALLFAVGFGFTSTLFNSTLRENHETVRRWVKPVLAPMTAVAGRFSLRWSSGADTRSRARRVIEPISIVVLAALIYSFLDPSFSFSSQGLQLFLSLLVSVAVVTYLYEGVQCRLCRTRYQAPAALRLYPAALLVAIGCVVVSRIAGFSPGYLYGFVGAMAFLTAAQPSVACRGRMVLIASLGLLAISVGTWFLAVPLSSAAAGGGWLPELLQGTAIAVFVAGLESVFFGLVPLSFMDGETLLRWRRPLWLVVFAAVAFMFWHVLLNKNSKYGAAFSGQSTRVMVGLLAAFTALTLASYFYFRSRRPQLAGSPLAVAAGGLGASVGPGATAGPGVTAGPSAWAMTASTAAAVVAAPRPMPAVGPYAAPAAPAAPGAEPQAVSALAAAAMRAPAAPAATMPATSVAAEEMKSCPACGAQIRAQARLCRFCRARFELRYSGYCGTCHDIERTDESGVCVVCGARTVDLHVETAPAQEGTVVGAAVSAPDSATPATRATTVGTKAPPLSSRRSVGSAKAAQTAVLLGERGRPSAVPLSRQLTALGAGVAGILAGAGLCVAWGVPWYEQTQSYVLFYENPPALVACGVLLIVLGVVTAICRRRRWAVLGLGIASVVGGGLAVYVTTMGRSTLEEAGVAAGGGYGAALALAVASLLPGALALGCAVLSGWRRGGS